MSSSKTYVLTWTIDGAAGAFCPAGGLSAEEVEAAEWRLRRRVEGAGVDPAVCLSVRRVPYVFDISEAPMPEPAMT